MNDFLKKMKDFADKGLEVSKEALGKAGDTVQTLGAKGVTKIELTHLNNQAQKQFAALGIHVYDLLVLQKKASLTAADAEVSDILAEISRLNAEIDKRSDKLEFV